MAYGGAPTDSLQKLMSKRQPITNAQPSMQSSGNGQIEFKIIQDIYQKAMINNTHGVNISGNMSKEDRQILIETNEEYKRRGFFKRIFPCADFLYYKQFFEEERQINYFLDARLYGKKRGLNPIQLRKHQAQPYFMNQDAFKSA